MQQTGAGLVHRVPGGNPQVDVNQATADKKTQCQGIVQIRLPPTHYSRTGKAQALYSLLAMSLDYTPAG